MQDQLFHANAPVLNERTFKERERAGSVTVPVDRNGMGTSRRAACWTVAAERERAGRQKRHDRWSLSDLRNFS